MINEHRIYISYLRSYGTINSVYYRDTGSSVLHVEQRLRDSLREYDISTTNYSELDMYYLFVYAFREEIQKAPTDDHPCRPTKVSPGKPQQNTPFADQQR